MIFACEGEKSMKKVPITSKQIEYVQFDERTREMSVHYYTGEVRNYGLMAEDELSNLMVATNKYDQLVEMTARSTLENKMQ
jgi:hypothetical protein